LLPQGPQPSAIATGSWDNDTQMIFIANGVVGGIYTYSVTQSGTGSSPTPHLDHFIRRGNPGLSWTEAFSHNNTDFVGEPGITDLLYVSQPQSTRTSFLLFAFCFV
jgi:hypothetical protein